MCMWHKIIDRKWNAKWVELSSDLEIKTVQSLRIHRFIYGQVKNAQELIDMPSCRVPHSFCQRDVFLSISIGWHVHLLTSNAPQSMILCCIIMELTVSVWSRLLGKKKVKKSILMRDKITGLKDFWPMCFIYVLLYSFLMILNCPYILFMLLLLIKSMVCLLVQSISWFAFSKSN